MGRLGKSRESDEYDFGPLVVSILLRSWRFDGSILSCVLEGVRMARGKLRMASVGREKRKDADYQSLTKPGGRMSARSENTPFPSRPVQSRSLPHLR